MFGIEAARRAYAQQLVRDLGPGHERLLEAFAATPRERFLGAPPWPLLRGGFTRQWSDDPRELYDDVLVGLDVELGINNGQPSLHARCLAACDPQPGETALHVGAGTGYYSAILAHLVGPRGRVIAYEIEAHLAERAAANLAPLPQVSVRATSGAEPPLPACDVIYVSAGRLASGAGLARCDAHRCAVDVSAHRRRRRRLHAARHAPFRARLRGARVVARVVHRLHRRARCAASRRRCARRSPCARNTASGRCGATTHPMRACGSPAPAGGFRATIRRIDRASDRIGSRTIARCWR